MLGRSNELDSGPLQRLVQWLVEVLSGVVYPEVVHCTLHQLVVLLVLVFVRAAWDQVVTNELVHACSLLSHTCQRIASRAREAADICELTSSPVSNPLDVGGPAWARYAEGTVGRDPMPFLEVALSRFDPGEVGTAIDLGCGAGNETLALLEAGWTVHAVDGEPKAIEILESRADHDGLSTEVGLFHEVALPEADLVFASLSLPFAAQQHDESIERALAVIKPGGWFVGVLLGHNDTWSPSDDTHTVDREDIDRLFDGFDPVFVDEEEFDGPSSIGDKRWHWYVVSARRPS